MSKLVKHAQTPNLQRLPDCELQVTDTQPITQYRYARQAPVEQQVELEQQVEPESRTIIVHSSSGILEATLALLSVLLFLVSGSLALIGVAWVNDYRLQQKQEVLRNGN